MDLITKEQEKPASVFTRLKLLLIDLKATFKEGGFKLVIRKFGWKVFALFFVYYLIRDVTLYILLPWMISKSLIAN